LSTKTGTTILRIGVKSQQFFGEIVYILAVFVFANRSAILTAMIPQTKFKSTVTTQNNIGPYGIQYLGFGSAFPAGCHIKSHIKRLSRSSPSPTVRGLGGSNAARATRHLAVERAWSFDNGLWASLPFSN
jgi:hypothetical protein